MDIVFCASAGSGRFLVPSKRTHMMIVYLFLFVYWKFIYLWVVEMFCIILGAYFKDDLIFTNFK